MQCRSFKASSTVATVSDRALSQHEDFCAFVRITQSTTERDGPSVLCTRHFVHCGEHDEQKITC
jgi:hypothetical protein